MSKPNALRELIDLIKFKTDMTQAEIADRSGYKRTYLSEALAKPKPPEKLLTKLKLTFKDVLESEHKQTLPKLQVVYIEGLCLKLFGSSHRHLPGYKRFYVRVNRVIL